MSHDTDKLIRQLSLVAFLMAERRALTARDVKGNVEGYSEMSDEAFARRFYSDRAELLALGVPLDSQRDEFTGEELYTLRSERYFLGELELTDDELAALQTAFFLLEGRFAYAEPLRLALQNLALGRPGLERPPSGAADRVQIREVDYSPETPGRLAKLEGAISKQRTVKFNYHAISRNEEHERTIDPVRPPPRRRPLVRDRPRPRPRREPDLPRLADQGRDPAGDEARTRLPAPGGLRRRGAPRTGALADRRPGRRGAHRGRRRHGVVGRARVRPGRADRGRRLRHAVREPRAARPLDPAPGRPGRPGVAAGAAPGGEGRARARPGAPRGRAAVAREGGEAEGSGAARAARLPCRAGAVRTAPGAARLPARPLRREHEHGYPGRRAERALPHCARGARGAPVAPEPRELRRRLLRGLRRAAR